MGQTKVIGKIDEKVIQLLGRSIKTNTNILIGDTNIDHMKKEHPQDYEKYGDQIDDILTNPDYVANHPKNNSIQYIKVYKNTDEDHVLVAIRVTGKGQWFARSLFVMSDEKVNNYRRKNALKKY